MTTFDTMLFKVVFGAQEFIPLHTKKDVTQSKLESLNLISPGNNSNLILTFLTF